jgi:hypothetical protein
MAEFGEPAYDDDDVKTVFGLTDVDLEPGFLTADEWIGWPEATAMGIASYISDYAP